MNVSEEPPISLISPKARANLAAEADRGGARAMDNVFVARLSHTVKYEDIYLKEYATVPSLEDGLRSYFTFYNNERPHQSLGYCVPAEVHYARC
jgi:putative transposase